MRFQVSVKEEMATITRIDVRNSQANAGNVASIQRAKGDEVTWCSIIAVRNWSSGVSAPDVVASDWDSKVWVVTTRVS